MIVIGSPLLSLSETTPRAAGLAVGIARAAAATGVGVELVGRVGDDAAGDALLLDLAAAGIGHVAMIRDPGQPTGTWAPDPEPDVLDASDPTGEDESPLLDAIRPSPPDAADLDLALRYLPEYRVIVVADDLEAAALESVAGAARWSSASLVVVAPPGGVPDATLPAEVTLLEAPEHPDDAFAAFVGSYAAALDRGEDPAAAFAAAAGGTGWTETED